MRNVYCTDFYSSYYIHGLLGDEINFCCFIRVTQQWALHVVVKRQFYIYNYSFLPQSTVKIQMILLLKTNGFYVGISVMVSILATL